MTKREVEFVWNNADPEGGTCDLWCDEEYIEQIRALEGIGLILPAQAEGLWNVTFDLRYDPLEVMGAVEAIIMEDKA